MRFHLLTPPKIQIKHQATFGHRGDFVATVLMRMSTRMSAQHGVSHVFVCPSIRGRTLGVATTYEDRRHNFVATVLVLMRMSTHKHVALSFTRFCLSIQFVIMKPTHFWLWAYSQSQSFEFKGLPKCQCGQIVGWITT